MAAEETHLSWRVVPISEGVERLTGANYPRPPKSDEKQAPSQDIGILYYYSNKIPPRIVTWLQPEDDVALQRLKRQAHTSNDFAIWLAEHDPVGVWTLATAWTFYEQWLTYAHHPNWLVAMRKLFLPDPLLDQLLAQSQGWVLWRFQLDALLFAGTGDLGRAQDLAKFWMLHPAEAPALLTGINLPNGVAIRTVLEERSVRTSDGNAIVRGRPDMHTVLRIHQHCTEHVA